MAEVLIVTGGSRGIGAACARLGAARGYDVCVNYLENAARAEQVVAEVRAAGRRAIAVQADLASEPDILRLFAATDRELGTVTALINNAARTVSYGPTTRVTAATLAPLWATNITGPFIACREAVRRMSTRHGGKGGAICNISSIGVTLLGGGQFVDYAASKAALEALTLGLAQEVADQGIRVTAIRPGLIDTEIHVRAGNPNRVAEVAPTLPLKRAGTPEEVAAVVLFLLSAEASYVTKTILDIAGGR
ncbi:MAG: SDR family oxidoreductase [Alphaproteobacteria bacterium]|nr:SDR family oxidoreductase [Alphaproteobacteria bacterium]